MARLEQDYTGDLTALEYTPKKVIAPGKYKALITQCDYTPNKLKNGFNLIPTFQIVEGEYQGEEITQYLSIKNPSKQAQDIAVAKKARLGVILCGTPNPADTDLLLNKLLIIETDTEANNYTNKEGVEVKGTNNIIKQYHPKAGEFKDLVQGKKVSFVASFGEDKTEEEPDSIPF